MLLCLFDFYWIIELYINDEGYAIDSDDQLSYFDYGKIEPRLIAVISTPYRQPLQSLVNLWEAVNECSQHNSSSVLFTFAARAGPMESPSKSAPVLLFPSLLVGLLSLGLDDNYYNECTKLQNPRHKRVHKSCLKAYVLLKCTLITCNGKYTEDRQTHTHRPNSCTCTLKVNKVYK